MAIKPQGNETFYREVDEELRKEQLSSFWKRYGLAVIGAALLFLAGLAGFPQLSLPLGKRLGAPLGLSLLGPAGSDGSLVAMAERIAG